MVIVVGSFKVEPAERDAFLASKVDAMRQSRSEPGCVTYIFSADPVEPDVVQLFERWESKEHLDAHLAGIRAAPAPTVVVPAQRVELLLYGVIDAVPLVV